MPLILFQVVLVSCAPCDNGNWNGKGIFNGADDQCNGESLVSVHRENLTLAETLPCFYYSSLNFHIILLMTTQTR